MRSLAARLNGIDAYIQSMAAKYDIYDSEPWTEMDVQDLMAALKAGDSIEEAATHLCRSGTLEDRRRAEELGLL